MKNKEMFADKIFELACRGESIAVSKKTNEVVSCRNMTCADCIFHNNKYHIMSCRDLIQKWCESEYVDSIDWSKVEVDTPILVRSTYDESWYKRHFAEFKDGVVYAWDNGCTSWAVDHDIRQVTGWAFAKLPDKEDV